MEVYVMQECDNKDQLNFLHIYATNLLALQACADRAFRFYEEIYDYENEFDDSFYFKMSAALKEKAYGEVMMYYDGWINSDSVKQRHPLRKHFIVCMKEIDFEYKAW